MVITKNINLGAIKDEKNSNYNIISNLEPFRYINNSEIDLESTIARKKKYESKFSVLHKNYRSTVVRADGICMKRYTKYRVKSLSELRGKNIVNEEIEINNLLMNKEINWGDNEPPKFYGFIPNTKKYNNILVFKYIPSIILEKYLKKTINHNIIDQIYRTLRLEEEFFDQNEKIKITEETLKGVYPELERFMSFELDGIDHKLRKKLEFIKRKISSLKEKLIKEDGHKKLIYSRTDPEASNFIVDKNENIHPIDFSMLQEALPTFPVGYLLSHDKPIKKIPRENFRKLKKTLTRKELKRTGEKDLFKLSILNGYWGPSTRIFEKNQLNEKIRRQEILENIEKSKLLFRGINEWLEW